MLPNKKIIDELKKLAIKAKNNNEVPISAIIAKKNKIFFSAYNTCHKTNNPLNHAEMIVITSAMNHIGAKYLKDCVLYVTLEPCLMRAGAIQLSKLAGIVYGANDEKMGFSQKSKNAFPKAFKIKGGVLHEESTSLLKAFFKAKR